MREPIQRYFQLGVVQWMIHPKPHYSLAESLALLARDDFFEVVEIPPIADPKARKQAKELLDTAHMTVCCGAHPMILDGLNPNSLDEKERRRAEEALMGVIDMAHEMQSHSVCILSGKWPEDLREDAYRQLLKTTIQLCRYAAQFDIAVEMEVFDYDVDKRVLIGPAPLAARFAADVRCSCQNFGLVVDLSHLPLTHEDVGFAVRTMRPYITHFHIGNAVLQEGSAAYGDKHPRFGFPGGVNDVAELTEFFRVLRDEGFFRPENPQILSIEVKPQGDEDAQIILANTKRVIRRAWAALED